MPRRQPPKGSTTNGLQRNHNRKLRCPTKPFATMNDTSQNDQVWNSPAVPKRWFFSLLIGLSIGFLIGATALVVIRGMESESDGMAALFSSLAIFAPIAIATGIVGFLGRSAKNPGSVNADDETPNSQTPRMHKPLALTAFALGCGAAAALAVVVPTEQTLLDRKLAEHRPHIQKQAAMLADFRDQVDAIELGTAGDLLTDESKQNLKAIRFDFRDSDYPRIESWNTLLSSQAEYARLKKDTNPDEIMDSWDRPNPRFLRADRYQYSSDSRVDHLAQLAYGDGYLFEDELSESIFDAEHMKYVIFVRVVDENPPVLTGEEFEGGFISAEAFVFDVEDSKIVAAFPFAATNSERVEYSYAENESVTGQADSAIHSVVEDLHKNLWPAFWVRIHELAPESKSDYSELKLPYKPVALASAYLNWQKQKQAEKETENKINSELKSQGLELNF